MGGTRRGEGGRLSDAICREGGRRYFATLWAMDALRTYEYLELSRRRVLDAVRGLSEEQYRREFAIGLGSMARTLTHMLGAEWYYIQRMEGREVPPYETWAVRDEAPLGFDELEERWRRQGEETRGAFGRVRDWSAPIEYQVTDDEGREMIVTASAADLFTQLALHEVHHRAQVLNMLRQMGVVLGDIDFNAMMYPRREV